MNDKIATYIAKGSPWQQDACVQLRKAILTALPEAEESLQYNKPHFAVDGRYVAALHVAKAKVSLLILDAGAIEPEKGFLRSMGNGDRKVVDVTDGQVVDVDRVVATLQRAHAG